MILLVNKIKIYQFIRFVIVGIFNTILDLVVLNLLVYIFSISDPLSFSICKGVSFIVALVNSYFMNKYFTFAQKETTNKNFYVFVIFSLVGLIVNISISSLTFYLLGFYSSTLSIALVTTLSGMTGSAFGMLINYFNYSFFVFK